MYTCFIHLPVRACFQEAQYSDSVVSSRSDSARYDRPTESSAAMPSLVDPRLGDGMGLYRIPIEDLGLRVPIRVQDLRFFQWLYEVLRGVVF